MWHFILVSFRVFMLFNAISIGSVYTISLCYRFRAYNAFMLLHWFSMGDVYAKLFKGYFCLGRMGWSWKGPKVFGLVLLYSFGSSSVEQTFPLWWRQIPLLQQMLWLWHWWQLLRLCPLLLASISEQSSCWLASFLFRNSTCIFCLWYICWSASHLGQSNLAGSSWKKYLPCCIPLDKLVLLHLPDSYS